jgi:hypothetical protein
MVRGERGIYIYRVGVSSRWQDQLVLPSRANPKENIQDYFTQATLQKTEAYSYIKAEIFKFQHNINTVNFPCNLYCIHNA